jgi:anti-sigma regulatory factor (Ser/Thr protein kinase)
LAPARARAAVRGLSREREISPRSLDALALLVSELVSNAVLHSDASPASPIVLRARLVGDEAIRIEVIDEGSGFAAVPREPAGLEGGYGLMLVDSEARSWGIDRRFGTCAWFEIADDEPKR